MADAFDLSHARLAKLALMPLEHIFEADVEVRAKMRMRFEAAARDALDGEEVDGGVLRR